MPSHYLNLRRFITDFTRSETAGKMQTFMYKSMFDKMLFENMISFWFIVLITGHSEILQCVVLTVALCRAQHHGTQYYQWPLLLTWFNFNPRMDK